MKSYVFILLTAITIGGLACSKQMWTSQSKDGYTLIENKGGQTLGYSPASGVKLIIKNGLAFKDLNKDGVLNNYEDWRLDDDARAKDLASLLTLEQIGGLMLYSSHQSIPARAGGYFSGTYDGKPFEQGVTDPTSLTDQQKKFLKDDNLRHVLITTVQSAEIAAKWNNKVQAFCEGVDFGIPANNSSDPRHATNARAEFDAAAGGAISMWPRELGISASFDPELMYQFGTIAAAEYRNLGITTALSPQIDIATEPRWMRFNGTFGESPYLSAAMARAYCDGFQSDMWGDKSVNAMVKHWPGGGAGESGRDAHFGHGKFAVYPGNNFGMHMYPFTEGAFKLKGGTKMASAVMPYYTISWNQTNENVANNFNQYIITDLLRNKYQYDGVLCTDWSVTKKHNAMDVFVDGKPWGVEHLSEEERHYKAILAGIDQFGGNNDVVPIIKAYEMGVAAKGEAWMRKRMEESAVRLLKNIFRVGLFENPYLDPAQSKNEVGKAEYMKAGFEAQKRSIVLLKNKANALPVTTKKTVYIPKRYVAASRNFLGVETPATEDYPVNLDIVKKYFNVTDDASKADFGFVLIEAPRPSYGYDKKDIEKGGNGYIPISLQYKPYTAKNARETSIAGGDPLENFTNRSYKGKTTTTENASDMDLVINTKAKLGNKSLIVAVSANNPMVFAEIEPSADAILMAFGVQDQALMEIVAGKFEPSALLPMQMPADMETVETNMEDLPFDLKCYRDSEGHVYDFGYGMNWKGVISDERTKMYGKKQN
ncbi:MAG: glycoside hydrolase family 3 C-terminal domain-containing protein [Saprospiraceae bacterium]|nr:glycoside hydrolase family 3 C-terminal domain-containing protein [Saprospiraceae bacterium]